jgi:hypothetical protein
VQNFSGKVDLVSWPAHSPESFSKGVVRLLLIWTIKRIHAHPCSA